jgi:hypothetical protein
MLSRELLYELAAEEASLLAEGIEYPSYTPYGNESSAAVLLDLLNKEADQ